MLLNVFKCVVDEHAAGAKGALFPETIASLGKYLNGQPSGKVPMNAVIESLKLYTTIAVGLLLTMIGEALVQHGQNILGVGKERGWWIQWHISDMQNKIDTLVEGAKTVMLAMERWVDKMYKKCAGSSMEVAV